MTFPALPDWLPWWVPILVLIPLGLWGLAMLVLPFSVIGLKPRLEGMEARLDDIQADIRALVLRLPESAAERMSYAASPIPDTGYVQPDRVRPPIPPAPPAQQSGGFVPRQPRAPDATPRLDERPYAEPRRPAASEEPRETGGEREDPRPAPSPRSEPRFDWRR